jgi:nucleoside-diphosphate-sugar epimerase
MASDHRGPLNIGNPSEYSVLQLARLIQELTGTAAPIEFRPLPGDDPKQRRPDITLATTVLKWQPRVPVTTGLASTIDYFQEQLGVAPVAVNGHRSDHAFSGLTIEHREAVQPTVN